ncbi:MAG: hypothetical protein LUQ22_04595 [Methanotrichaceae archaeon]|nr:hypothetical protein [Methanotrichaceae archaeon]
MKYNKEIIAVLKCIGIIGIFGDMAPGGDTKLALPSEVATLSLRIATRTVAKRVPGLNPPSIRISKL